MIKKEYCFNHSLYFFNAFFRAQAFLLVLCLSSEVSIAQSRPIKPVNVLVIMADDMSMSAGIYGDHTISTPGIDGLARDGVTFDYAYCAASSCSPSRASILTGQYPHQLEEGGNLWGSLPYKYDTYTRILNRNGYSVGFEGKGWGPGDFKAGGYSENPAGTEYQNFEQFMKQLPSEKPFCFWVGSHDPHRPYFPELKKSVSFNESALKVPSWIPVNEVIKEDFLDYYAAVKRFDQTVEQVIKILKDRGLYEQTLIIITSDNGMPFPRIKANSYEASTHIPLVMRWGNHFMNGKRLQEFVNLIDLAPTILNIVDIKVPEEMTGKTLLPLLAKGKKHKRFQRVFTERERHAKVRENNLGYPMRAIRTKDYLFIQNLNPERWPAGDPVNDEPTGPFGDIDPGPTKKFIVDNRDNPHYEAEVNWSIEKRPAEELYDLKKDPDQLKNIAGDAEYRKVKKKLGKKIMRWRNKTDDPLLKSDDNPFDTYRYYGGKRVKNQ